MSRLTECPDCGAKLKRENFERHRRGSHFESSAASESVADWRRSRSDEREREQTRSRKRGTRKRGLVIIGLSILAIVGVISLVLFAPALHGPGGGPTAPPDPSKECVNHGGIGIHWHVVLKIHVSGSQVPIPENVGIENGCMHPLHTHAADRDIHVEYRYEVEFTLGQFFDLWGQPLEKDRLLDRTGTVLATLNGKPAGDPRSIPLLDRSDIELSIT